ncbi:MAG: HK97 family phage prohead protease [Rhodospirillales bacterium]|nr:HK97 family phage prohead protease [Rhodospirillales bacterium]
MTNGLERRAAASLVHPAPGKLAGYAAVYGAWSSDLGGFAERVAPGAFDASLAAPRDILALWDHRERHVLGRVGAGTLRLGSDAIGLSFELDLPDTTAGRDLAVLVSRRDVAGASFAFRVQPGGERWSFDDGKVRRTLTDVALAEITVTAQPAYGETSVALRSLQQQRRWLEQAAGVLAMLEARAQRWRA